MRRTRLVAWVIVGCLSGCTAALKAQQADDIERAMSWLPSDTETVIAARGRFVVPAAFPDQKPAKFATSNDVDLLFQSLPMALIDIQGGLFMSHLKGLPVAAAIEGSRHARSPQGLGMQPYEGAAIVIFDSAAQFDPDALSQALKSKSIRTEDIQDTHVFVFQEKLEDDLWTHFVAIPEKNVLIVATDRRYLQEVLAGRNAIQRVALPNSLPEWKYVDRRAAYWGIRHYDKNQAQSDPSSPFGGKKAANFPDQQAIGICFSVSNSNPRHVSLTYLSGDTGMTLTTSPLGILTTSPDAKGIEMKSNQIEPGVVQLSSSFTTVESLDTFLFFLESYLGHAIYL